MSLINKILEKTKSGINGEIEVHRDLAWGTYFKVNGVTQSGGIVKDIWKKTLKVVKSKKRDVKSVLVLGLGGGSNALIASKYWPDAKITGVDIDGTIVDLGFKYLKLGEIRLETKIEDASKFVSGEVRKKKYDLILVDLYVGGKFPEKFEEEGFVRNVKKLLNNKGIVVFNRLYGADNRIASVKFGAKLEKLFGRVNYFYPQANLELICYN